MKRTLVLDNTQVEQRINRIAHEIYENNYGEKEIIVAGIVGGGYVLAQRLVKTLAGISPLQVKLFEIQLNKKDPYKDDAKFELGEKEIKNKVIILVDDVLNSGKTLIFGVKHFLKSPVKRISTVVLVDRNHTRYPVKPDYTGISLSTTLQEHITVELANKGKDAVYLE